MKTIQINLYPYDELNDTAKAKAREWYKDSHIDDWNYWQAEGVIEDAKQAGKCLGIDIDKVYYSGFYSQGDGACFEGDYTYKTDALTAIKAYAPKDKTLHTISRSLKFIQSGEGNKLFANIRHSGHYYHSRCTVISVERDDGKEVKDEQEHDLITVLREFMDWIYEQLKKEYEYNQSDEYIVESIIDNEYMFTEDGAFFE